MSVTWQYHHDAHLAFERIVKSAAPVLEDIGFVNAFFDATDPGREKDPAHFTPFKVVLKDEVPIGEIWMCDRSGKVVTVIKNVAEHLDELLGSVNLQAEIEAFIEWAMDQPDDHSYGEDVPAAVRAYLAWKNRKLVPIGSLAP